ncbi:hypothetical protein L7F22_028720 [Adiantum nelumboides]|nr:hypothetical protein [Adiantum nelumboides]
MCMESKDPGMGLPTGAGASMATSTTAVTHNGNSEAASVRPDATKPTHADVSPNPGASLSISTAPSPLHFNSTPPPYMTCNMSTSIVPVSMGGFNFIASSTASGFESMKKKRGRPRKYAPEGSRLALTVTPLSALAPSPSLPSQKRGRGRPPGSGKNQQLAALGELMLGSIGAGFTPHAITVATGEDIASRIMSFSQQGPRGICILSANGAISSVTLRQPSISGGIVTYEGRFEILSLSGSFLLTEFGYSRSRTGGLSVSLAGPDGRVVGGSIAGVLIAASPVQVIVGSFLCHKKKPPKPAKPESPAGFAKPTPLNAAMPTGFSKPTPLNTAMPTGFLKPTPLNTAMQPIPSMNAGNVGPNLSFGDLERKPVLAESHLITQSPWLNRSTTGGSISSNAASSLKVPDQAMPPQSLVSESTTPKVLSSHIVQDQAKPPQSLASQNITPNVPPSNPIAQDQAKPPRPTGSQNTSANILSSPMVQDQAKPQQPTGSQNTSANVSPSPMVQDQAKPPQSTGSQNTKEEKPNANISSSVE